MKYELKIEHALEKKGTIDLQRLAVIAEGIKKISEGALQIRLRGVSLTKGRKKISLKDALRVSLTSIKEGSTILCLESEEFRETLAPYQSNIFRQEVQRELLNQTPVSLFIKSFQDAINDTDYDLLDKPLLRELKQFSKSFLKDDEVFIISNQGNLRELELKKQDFNKIKLLEDEIPGPEPVIINGVVEELKYSKLKVKIKTEEGIVDGSLTEEISEKIGPFFGKRVNITGTTHYKPGGKSVVEIERIFEAGEEDVYFSKKPKSETVEQQIQKQLIEKKGKNMLSEIVGKWPGDETDEEFEELLKQLD